MLAVAELCSTRAILHRETILLSTRSTQQLNNNQQQRTTTQQQPTTTQQQSDNNQRQQHSDGEEHSIILGRLALKHDEAGRWTIGSTDQSGRWARKDLPQRHVAPWSVARKGTRWWFPPTVVELLQMIERSSFSSSSSPSSSSPHSPADHYDRSLLVGGLAVQPD